MELSEKQIHRFAELERCYSQYFSGSVAPIMEQVRREVSDKQLEEFKEYSNSFSGMLSMVSNPMGGPSSASLQMVTRTGIWSQLKTEDFITMCQERIGKSEQITADLKLIADDWRNELVATIGRERYDTISKELGTDLAYAYTGFRMERLMIDRLIRQNMPKSSLDYVMKSAAENSLLGLPAQLQRSPLDREIAEAGEKAYGPSLLEKGTSKVLGFGMDTVTTCGFSSWASVGKLALFEVASEGVGAIYDATRDKNEEPTVEEFISKGVFGNEGNILTTFCNEAKHIEPHESDYMKGLNEKMQGRLRLIPEDNLAWMKEIGWQPAFKLNLEKMMNKNLLDTSSALLPNKKDGRNVKSTFGDIPAVVRPGKEKDYLAMQEERNKQSARPIEKTVPVADNTTVARNKVMIEGQEVVPIPEQTPSSKQAVSSPQISSSEQSGWGSMLSSVGLSDVGSVGRNMGYVVSMLPDLLVGLFTGKTKSLKLMDNLFPIASILMGLFSRNPLVKMLLVGLGGMNLMNKAGHEALGKKTPAEVQTAGVEKREYKTYADEALNPRVTNPEIKGDYLLATVDHVPCTIRLPEATVSAYRNGALPLNTLVNAVLTKSDELRAMAQENYEATEYKNVQARGIV